MSEKAKFMKHEVQHKGSIHVNEVFSVYESEDIILAEIDTITKHPYVDAIGDTSIVISASKESPNVIYANKDKGGTVVNIEVPEGMTVWNANAGRYSVYITFARESKLG